MKSKNETNGLEKRIQNIEEVIQKKGIGSDYLQNAARVQRDVNIGLILGAAATIVGLTAWIITQSKEK